jgi:hypothetical protein
VKCFGSSSTIDGVPDNLIATIKKMYTDARLRPTKSEEDEARVREDFTRLVAQDNNNNNNQPHLFCY